MITVKTVQLADIKENYKLYVVIENNGKKEAINVGLKTYDRINELINPKQTELPLKDKKKEESK